MLRPAGTSVDVLIGHMGGPLWARKDEGAWSVPKGLVEPAEDPLGAAYREFSEETGMPAPEGPPIDIGAVRANGKTVQLWALWGDPDLREFDPGTFRMEWPPHSGRTITAPEIDLLRWASLAEAETLLVRAQRPFLPRLAALSR